MSEDKLSNHYGVDIENQLMSLLSEEIAKSIDKDILRSMGLEPDKNKRRKNKIKFIFNI